MDRHLGKKLKEELPGILNRVIEGYHRLLDQGDFTYSKAIEQAGDDYEADSNTVLTFVGEKIEITDKPKDLVGALDLYKSYSKFCYELNNTPASRKKFSDDFSRCIKRKGESISVNGVKKRLYRGVRLKDSLDLSGPRSIEGVDF